MKILKKYLQNRKGLQKLDTKHVPHSPKEETFFLKHFVTYGRTESLHLDIDLTKITLQQQMFVVT